MHLWTSLFKPQMIGPRRATNLTLIDRMFLLTPQFVPWFEIRPSQSWFELDDETTIHALRMRLNKMIPFPLPTCPDDEPTLQSDPQKFQQHISTCNKCGTKSWWMRHQAVLNAMMRALQHHHIQATYVKKTDLPLNERTQGGFDFFVWSDNLYGGDVTICNETTDAFRENNVMASRINRTFTRKLGWYKNFSNVKHIVTAPICLNIFGIIHPKTLELLRTWTASAPDPATALFDCIAHMQFALIKCLRQGYLHLQAVQSGVQFTQNDLQKNIRADNTLEAQRQRSKRPKAKKSHTSPTNHPPSSDLAPGEV
jgi:hypothetical protein